MPTATGLEVPWWLQVTHLINFLFLGLLVRSGWEILASHPRLYWHNDCGPDTEWLKFTKDQVPRELGRFTARDDQRSLHPLISLPGRAKIGLGRGWHGLVTVLWVLNGLVYLILLFGTGQWRRLIPTSWEVFPHAWESLKIYAGLGVPSIEQVEPLDEANYVMIESFGMAQSMNDGRPVEPYYTVLTRTIAMEDETILAWGMER